MIPTSKDMFDIALEWLNQWRVYEKKDLTLSDFVIRMPYFVAYIENHKDHTLIRVTYEYYNDEIDIDEYHILRYGIYSFESSKYQNGITSFQEKELEK